MPIDALIRAMKRLSAVTSAEQAGLPENAGSSPRTTPLNGSVDVGGCGGGPGADGCRCRELTESRVGEGDVAVENSEGERCCVVGVGEGELVSKGLGGEVGEVGVLVINIQSDGRDDAVCDSGELAASGGDVGW